MQIDVARSGLFNLDIAATGTASHRARDLPRPHIARSSLNPDLALQVGKSYVARPSLHFGVTARALDSLIARAALGADRRVGRHSDVVINGNVPVIHVFDVNAVATLSYRRILFDGVHVL